MLSKTIVKYIQRLAHKKFRDENGVFIAEGPKVVSELLHSGNMKCESMYATVQWFNENAGLLPEIFPTVDIIGINEIELKKISQLQTPNKVLAVFYKKEDKISELKNNISLMLDDIQDPGNMGTIIRTADWFGIKSIICSNNCVDYYTPKVVQSTMGSLARVNIIYTHLNEFINLNSGVNIYAAALNGSSIFSINKIKEGIILIGNESKGVSNDLLNISKELITIPRIGQAESLNAAVACGIILSHVV